MPKMATFAVLKTEKSSAIIAAETTILVIALVLLYYISYGLYSLFLHPLAKIPGPKIHAISHLPYVYHITKGDWHTTLDALHKRYGPVVRYGPNDVAFTSAEAFKKIYGSKIATERTFEKDPRMYKKRRPESHILNANNEDHRRFRKLLSHAFSEKALREQGDIIQHYVDMFISQLTDQARAGNTIDMVSWFNFATFDLIGDLAFGQSFGGLDNGNYHPWVKMIFENMKVMPFKEASIRLNLTFAMSYLTPDHLKKSAEEHYQLSKSTTVKRIESNNLERADFMSYILRYNDEKGMSVLEMAENAAIIIMAGSETTATLLSGTVFHLLSNPPTYHKLTQEIRCEFDSEEEINLARVNKLSYLIAVFNEAMRVYPPVPMGLARLVPTGGEIIDGYYLPEKTCVAVPHWTAFRTSHNFKDPESFVPERWLDDPRYKDDSKAALQPFSLGPRNCIGKNLAYAEMRLLLVRLLWKFDLEMLPGGEDWDKQKAFILWEKGALPVKLTEVVREQN
ncbi:unnamed protein product [Clonostachys rhizophaga]|uniref:Isotrichodermin C-15 hydroxylase n=1 Tax=Clonostachys rhizophaga TaxID=160324 RepID=A0A9N9YIF4_9HYPO|nr:unnamed protein product [Clonostachys rhizophaga]